MIQKCNICKIDKLCDPDPAKSDYYKRRETLSNGDPHPNSGYQKQCKECKAKYFEKYKAEKRERRRIEGIIERERNERARMGRVSFDLYSGVVEQLYAKGN